MRVEAGEDPHPHSLPQAGEGALGLRSDGQPVILEHSRAPEKMAADKVRCEACPVLVPCREMARRNGENGFWGGESEEERAAAGYAPVSISRRSVQDAASMASRTGAVAS